MKRFLICFILAILLSCPASAYPAVISDDVPPTITIQTNDCLVSINSVVTLNVTAIGTAPLKYQWQKKDYGTGLWSDINGANAAEYTFIAQAHTAAEYRVYVNNTYGSVTSNTMVVRIALPENPPPTDQADNGGGCNNVMSSGGTFGFAMILLASLACSLRSEKKKK